MDKQTIFSDKQLGLLNYLIAKAQNPQEEIPSIKKISADLGLSAACLREQMELAKNLGIISAQPRKGIEILPYDFKPAVLKSLYYAINVNRDYFYQYSELRNYLEKSFFIKSAQMLDKRAIDSLKTLVCQAKKKLLDNPIQIPHAEHRNYHLKIYESTNNVFLLGILEAYWDMYELVGLNLYNDYDYLISVWDYHKQIIEKTEAQQYEEAYQLLIIHMELIDNRKKNY